LNVAVVGNFTFADHAVFLEMTRRLLGPSGNPLIINLAGVAFIYSTALA